MPTYSDHGGSPGTRHHPATSAEIHYSDEEREFMMAIERFKREKKITFPTCSDILTVAKSLGYRRITL